MNVGPSRALGDTSTCSKGAEKTHIFHYRVVVEEDGKERGRDEDASFDDGEGGGGGGAKQGYNREIKGAAVVVSWGRPNSNTVNNNDLHRLEQLCWKRPLDVENILYGQKYRILISIRQFYEPIPDCLALFRN